MKKTPLHTIYEQQKTFFDSGKTLHYSFRLAALLRLEDALNTYEDALIKALNEDLKKSALISDQTYEKVWKTEYVIMNCDWTYVPLVWIRGFTIGAL